jgi:hypothetical protein
MWRQVADQGVAVAAGLREVGRFRNVDISDHPIVDVAAEDDDARLVEQYGLRGHARIERQIEALGG